MTATLSPQESLARTLRAFRSTGGHLFPCRSFVLGDPVSKRPMFPGWNKPAFSDEQLLALYEGNPCGVAWAIPKGIAVVDVDAPSPGRPAKQGLTSIEGIVRDLRLDLTGVPGARTASGGLHLYFRIPPDQLVRGRFPEQYPDLDVKTHGGYVLVPPSPHWEGGNYTWTPVSEMHLSLYDSLQIPDMPEEMFQMLKRSSVVKTLTGDTILPLDIIKQLLNEIPAVDFRGKGGEEFFHLLASVKAACGGSEEGCEAFVAWCETDPVYDTDENRSNVINRWNSTKVSGGVTAGTLIKTARRQLDRYQQSQDDSGWKRCHRLIKYASEALDINLLGDTPVSVREKIENIISGEDEAVERIVWDGNQASFIRRIADRLPTLASKYNLFVYGSRICTMVAHGPDDWRPEPLTSEGLLVMLSEVFVLVVESPHNNDFLNEPAKPTAWTSELANLILNQPNWPTLPLVSEISCSPLVTKDGAIVNDRGSIVDHVLCWSQDSATPISIPDEPTEDDARAALQRILDVVGVRRFHSPGFISVWLSGLFTVICRRMIDGPVPMIVVTSQDQGAGKTTMAMVPEMILRDCERAIRVNFNKEEEAEKQLGAAVMTSADTLVIDEVSCGKMGLESRLLNSFLTQKQPQIRKLGTSELIRAPRSPQIWMTGLSTHIRSGSTLERRLLPLVLVTPEGELHSMQKGSFNHHIRSHRFQLLADVVTIMRAWKRRNEAKPGAWASFEKWDEQVRQALVWLDAGDPCAVLNSAEAAFVLGKKGINADQEVMLKTMYAITLVEEAVKICNSRKRHGGFQVSAEDIKWCYEYEWKKKLVSAMDEGLDAYKFTMRGAMSCSETRILSRRLKEASEIPVNGKVLLVTKYTPLRFFVVPETDYESTNA